MGSGTSDQGIPFAYHADWGSTGRWSVEVHSRHASYRLCPLERLFRRSSATSEWAEVPVSAFAPQVKAGITEQVAGMLHQEIRGRLPLMTLRDAAALTSFGEELFGYDPTPSSVACSDLSSRRTRGAASRRSCRAWDDAAAQRRAAGGT